MGIHQRAGARTASKRPVGSSRNQALRRRRLALVGCAIFVFFPALVFGEKYTLEYEISNNPVGVKDRIYLNIYVNTPKPEDVGVEAPPLPKEIRITSGPKISRVADGGVFITRISYQLRGEQTGRYILKPFIVSVEQETLETDTRVLEVGLYQNRALVMPLEIEWEVPEEKIFVGQSVPVSLWLRNQLEIPLVDFQGVSNPKGAFFEEIDGYGEIEIVPAGSQFLYTIPISTYIFTPSQHGRLFLPAAEIEALGQQGASAVVRIDVQPLPQEVRDSGAVGDFSYRSWLDHSAYEFGTVGKLYVLVQGVGNLNFFKMPEPDLGDLVQTEVKETSEIVPVDRGYKGWRRTEFSFLSDTAGSYSVSVPNLVYFNPQTEEILTQNGSTFRIVYTQAEETVEVLETDFPFSIPSAVDIVDSRQWGAYKAPLNYFWLLPAPLAFLILLLLKRTKVLFVAMVCVFISAGGTEEEPCPDLVAAVAAYQAEDYPGAHAGFLRCNMHDNHALMYALALTEFKLGNNDDAMFFSRMSVSMDPMSREYRRFFSWLNTHMELGEPVAPAAKVHPDLFLIAMIVFFSAGFVAASLYLMRKKGGYIVICILGLILSLSSCAGLVYTSVQNSKTSAMIYGEPAKMRKIPSMTASEWMELPPGYSLRVLNNTEDFYLVRTAYGLTGWIEANTLVLDRR